MYNATCDHINSYKSKEGLDSYEILHAFYVSCIAKDSRKRKARDCFCMGESCQTRYQRIHACLSCIHFGCYNGGHIHEHANKSGHPLAIDTNFGYVYCFECGDYQYDNDFDKIAQKQKLIAARTRGEDANFKWEPSEREAELLRKHIIINIDHMKGVRGIKNLGNTCYMSVIILSLVHAPVFRDYLLSLKHKCNIQNMPPESQVQLSDPVMEKSKPVCFVCEMSEIIQEFFCGKTDPYILDRLLYLVWLQADDFKNTDQHDAHEFFLMLLNSLHLHCQGLNEKIDNHPNDDHPCDCIIDTIFTGLSQTEYTCPVCNYASKKLEPFKEIFLETQSHTLLERPSSLPERSLEDYLKGLQSGVLEKTCDRCKTVKNCSRMMTLKKLPLIMTFNLQQPQKEADKKYVSFPETIDMTQYMTSYKVQSNEEDNPLNGLSRVPNNMFYLFAVVKHTGAKVDDSGGHYTSYVRRHKEEWYFMNDEDVKQVPLEEVLSNKAYLLFYHKVVLEYEEQNFEFENKSV